MAKEKESTKRPDKLETRADAEQEAAHEWSQMTEGQRKLWRDQGQYINVRADNMLTRVKLTTKPLAEA